MFVQGDSIRDRTEFQPDFVNNRLIAGCWQEGEKGSRLFIGSAIDLKVTFLPALALIIWCPESILKVRQSAHVLSIVLLSVPTVTFPLLSCFGCIGRKGFFSRFSAFPPSDIVGERCAVFHNYCFLILTPDHLEYVG